MIKILLIIIFSVASIGFTVEAQAMSPTSALAPQKLLSTPEDTRQRACQPIGKGAAMSIVGRRVDGKVLSVRLNMRSRPPMYKVRVLTESGRVRHIYVNACNGRLV